MIQRRTAVFLINLIQDLAILRPLMIMARRDFGFEVRMLVSTKFRSRDLFGIWEAELEALCRETEARLVVYRTDLEAYRELDGTGVIFSASESSVPEHHASHSLLQYAPGSFLKVTLQHGFECVGFRHSAAHDRSYGPTVSFEADIVCTWQPPEQQHSLAGSQRPKIEVTGSTAVLQSFDAPIRRDPSAPGIVCENLHSVRLKSIASLGTSFLAEFEEFCRLTAEDGERVTLRPHPGGQYVLKNKLELPANVEVNNAPIYRVDLRRFAYGISAPSSVVIDMLLADIPTAIWRDLDGNIDTNNYAGLTTVSSARECREFSLAARADPGRFVRLQREFLAEQRMPLDPADVFARYARIFEAADRIEIRRSMQKVDCKRLLIVANAHLPTVQVCLEQPLKPLVQSGEVVLELLTESRLKEIEARLERDEVEQWISTALDWFGPDSIVFSRYSGPYASTIVEWARRNSVPIVYHLDDDLLTVPRSLGERKYAYHNASERLAAVRELLTAADLVYTSTEILRARIESHVPGLRAAAGAINASGTVLKHGSARKARVLGYMASADHLPNLEMILPALVDLLDRHTHLSFELFGSIPVPAQLARFGDRITSIERITDYEQFLEALGERRWDIGIAPLAPTDFNRAKSNNKWIEYTSLGIAVVASADMVYEECCADGCGLLASGLDGWRSALESLIEDDGGRLAMVERAQRRLETRYSVAAHRRQILGILSLASERAERKLIREDA
jgi:hypothetical protein